MTIRLHFRRLPPCGVVLSTRRGSSMKPSVFRIGALSLLAAAVLYAQSFTGTISGLVTDSSGAVIPGAQVTVLNVGTNVRSTATTDTSGSYTVPLLPRGDYRLEVSAGGFRRFVREGIVLQIQQTARVDVQMTVGVLVE